MTLSSPSAKFTPSTLRMAFVILVTSFRDRSLSTSTMEMEDISNCCKASLACTLPMVSGRLVSSL